MTKTKTYWSQRSALD